jgi:DAK2 domain fusion protein YloV
VIVAPRGYSQCVLESLDAAAARRWCTAALDALRRHQEEIDQLNVYPIPDGDTGTNLVLTVSAAYQELATDPDGGVDLDGELTRLGWVLRRMAHGALHGARGNSGVIVSQLLRGIAEALATTPAAGGRELAAALDRAAMAAWSAVSAPVEGTLLSVATAAARAATGLDSDDLAAVVRAAAEGAAKALARTPEQLSVLARAGVVDAGGRGLVVLLDALVEVVEEWGGTLGGGGQAEGSVPPAAPAASVHSPAAVAARESGSAAFAYEVQYLLDAPVEAVEALRADLSPLGDSVVVVGDGRDTWHVHVHVNDVGAAIEAGIRAGRPHRISVVRFEELPAATGRTVDRHARAAVVVASGEGLVELFRAEGAGIVPGPSTSAGELLAAIRTTGAGQVVLLPCDRATQAVAALAAEQARAGGVQVGVVPIRSPIQALAALAVRDAGRRFEDDIIAMAEAAGACRYAEVCEAAREAVTVAGLCRPGDILALIEGEVNLIGGDLRGTCVQLVDRLLTGGGELITLLTGTGAPPDLADLLGGHLSRRWPFVEVQIFDGGQPRYPLLVGVE